jgi:hypothetical protein
MAKGPFGNPLSTGIALSGVIDMVTPVREAQERKRKRQAEEKEAEDKRAKELGAVMGKIAIDEDKIWWRYHDDARSKYANTIDKVQQMYSAGDYAGMYKTINQFDTKMANYIQATNQKSKWEDSVRKGDKYYDQTYLNALENRDVDMSDLVKIADESGFGAYDPNTNILGFIDPVQRIDLREKVKKAIDGQKYMYEKQGKSLKVSGYGASGEPVYEMSLQDRQGTTDAVKKSIQPQAVPYMLMEMGYSKEDQLKMTPQELDQRLNEAIENTYNLYATKEERGPIPKEEGKGYNDGYGKTDEYSYEFVDDPKPIYGNLPASQTGGKGGQELLVDVDNSMVFQNVGKTAKKFAINIPAGSFEIGSEGTEYTPISSTQKGLNDAIALQSYSDKNGKLWYKVASKAEIEQLDVFEAAYRRSQGVDDIDYTSLSKYAKTYLIPSSSEVDSQFWQGVGVNRKEREVIIKDLKGGTSTTGTSSTSAYTQITTLTDSSGNSINAGVKGGKWYNVDTGEEIK